MSLGLFIVLFRIVSQMKVNVSDRFCSYIGITYISISSVVIFFISAEPEIKNIVDFSADKNPSTFHTV